MSKTKWYHKPIYALVALALVFSLGIMAVPMARTVEASPGALDMSNWADYAENPVFGQGVDSGPKAYYPTVVYDGTKYLMLYDQPASYATSEDGIRWTSGGEVTGLTNARHMVMLYDANGFGGGSYKYKMWYFDEGASVPNGVDSIRYAESNNGIAWVNDQAVFGGNMVTSGVDNVDAPSRTWGPGTVLYNPEATNTGDNPLDYSYVMYYDGFNGNTDDTTWDNTEALFLAYSEDGISWNRYTRNPVLKGGSPDEWDNGGVGYPTVMGLGDGSYIVWYSGGGGCNQGIGFATSPDRIQWTKGEGNPMFHVSDTTDPPGYRAKRTYTPRVIDDGSGVLKMYYSAKSDIGLYAIGLALPAHPSQVWVDDEWTSQGDVYLSDTSLIWQYNAFATIQEGINAVAEGGAVNVAAGMYNEQVIIDKSLTLQGEDREATVIEYPSTLPKTQYLILVKADDVKITEFKLLGHFATTNQAVYVVYSYETGLIFENNVIQGFIGLFGNLTNAEVRNNFIGTTHKGIYVSGGNNLLIERNTFEPAEGAGSYTSNCGAIYMDHVTDVKIQDNTMRNFSSSTDTSITKGRGVEGSDNSYVTMSGNTFENIRDAITMWIVNNIDISKNLINRSDRFGINIKGQDILITGNTIQNSGDSGINIAKFVIETKNVGIHYNNLIGSQNFGVVINYDGQDVGEVTADATNNWWGDASGPYHAILNPDGSGDVVSDNVDFVPWLTAPFQVSQLYELQDELKVDISGLDKEAFSNEKAWAGQQKALLNKVDAVFKQVEAGAYRGAINKLQNDVKDKIEQWIIEGYQSHLIEKVNAAIEILKDLPE